MVPMWKAEAFLYICIKYEIVIKESNPSQSLVQCATPGYVKSYIRNFFRPVRLLHIISIECLTFSSCSPLSSRLPLSSCLPLFPLFYCFSGSSFSVHFSLLLLPSLLALPSPLFVHLWCQLDCLLQDVAIW